MSTMTKVSCNTNSAVRKHAYIAKKVNLLFSYRIDFYIWPLELEADFDESYIFFLALINICYKMLCWLLASNNSLN